MATVKCQTTVKDFELFKSECQKWIEKFGLNGWSVFYGHIEEKNDNLASCSYNLRGRVATIILYKTWDKLSYQDKNYQLRKSAFHEVRELFYARINIFAKDRYVDEFTIDEEIHNLIRNDENSIFKKEMNK